MIPHQIAHDFDRIFFKRKYVDRSSGIRCCHPESYFDNFNFNFFFGLPGYCYCHYGCCFWMFDSSCVTFDVLLTFSRGGDEEEVEEEERPSKDPVH